MKELLKTVYKQLSPRAAATVDYYLRPSLREKWGGPLNGQHYRQELVKEILSAIDFDLLVETGTFRGSTTEFLSKVFDGPIYTCEVDEKSYHYSKLRLRACARVSVAHDSSPRFLRELLGCNANSTVFLYLDAHWWDYLPLQDEISTIEAHTHRVVAMIDDFQVKDDPGYSYDDYGGGKSLTLDHIQMPENLTLFYPSTPSNKETGEKRRGCLVFANDEELARILRSCRLLRPIDKTTE